MSEFTCPETCPITLLPFLLACRVEDEGDYFFEFGALVKWLRTSTRNPLTGNDLGANVRFSLNQNHFRRHQHCSQPCATCPEWHQSIKETQETFYSDCPSQVIWENTDSSWYSFWERKCKDLQNDFRIRVGGKIASSEEAMELLEIDTSSLSSTSIIFELFIRSTSNSTYPPLAPCSFVFPSGTNEPSQRREEATSVSSQEIVPFADDERLVLGQGCLLRENGRYSFRCDLDVAEDLFNAWYEERLLPLVNAWQIWTDREEDDSSNRLVVYLPSGPEIAKELERIRSVAAWASGLYADRHDYALDIFDPNYTGNPAWNLPMPK